MTPRHTDIPLEAHPQARDYWRGSSKITDDERDAIARKWENSIYKLHSQTTGRARKSLAWDIYYLETYAGFGVPVVNAKGQWGLSYWLDRKDDGFVIVPLVKTDASLHHFFANALHRPSYREGPRAIYLPAARVSSTWRAIILHHELGHAMFHRLDIYRNEKMGHWAEEYEVYKNEIQLVRKLFGRRYSGLVRRLSVRFESGLRGGRLHIDSKLVPRRELEHLFGKPQSRLESAVQRSVILLDALYCALDRIHVDGDKSEHYKVTRWFYGHSK